jgi:hypothetical protein
MNNVFICGCFYSEPKDEKSNYGNLSKNKNIKETYWRNALNLFFTANLSNPKLKFLMFTNDVPPVIINNVLKLIGVKIIEIEYTHKPPKGYWKHWQSTFYLLDAMEYLTKEVDESDSVIMLDLDCVIVGPLDNFLNILRSKKVLVYDTGYSEDNKSNNVSRQDLKNLFEEIEEKEMSNVPKYFGGELYAVYGKSTLTSLYELSRQSWDYSKNNWFSRDIKFNTEEHVFNYALWKMGVNEGTANKFIKRMWTSWKYRNINNNDALMPIWHVPAEKSFGMIKLSNAILKEGNLIKQKDLPTYVGKYLTIPKRGVIRLIQDTLKQSIGNILKRLKVSRV